MDAKKTAKAVAQQFLEAGIEAEFRIERAKDGRWFLLLVGWRPSDKFPAARRVAAANELVLDSENGVIWLTANR